MRDEAKEYDLVVIGGGPAGVIGARTATVLGKTVALVDSHHEVGGAGIGLRGRQPFRSHDRCDRLGEPWLLAIGRLHSSRVAPREPELAGLRLGRL